MGTSVRKCRDSAHSWNRQAQISRPRNKTVSGWVRVPGTRRRVVGSDYYSAVRHGARTPRTIIPTIGYA